MTVHLKLSLKHIAISYRVLLKHLKLRFQQIKFACPSIVKRYEKVIFDFIELNVKIYFII